MEFLYTPQQIAGYKGYYYKVKLGNWSEDQELAELKLKNFIHKKERGTLATTIAEQKFARTLQSVPLESVTRDGYVHFGDVGMLFNQKVRTLSSCRLGSESFRI
jgi:hypothetical protein